MTEVEIAALRRVCKSVEESGTPTLRDAADAFMFLRQLLDERDALLKSLNSLYEQRYEEEQPSAAWDAAREAIEKAES